MVENQKLLLGTSGWSYKDWVGNFYPDGAKPSTFLKHYSNKFPVVEIDSTFYGTPPEKTVKMWKETTPAKFLFAAKFPQTITHDKKLLDCHDEVRFFLDRMSVLEDKLGPLLLQFPYGFRSDSSDVLIAFLSTLPNGFRYAIEVRNTSWLNESFYDSLRSRNISLALIDHPWMPKIDVVTGPFLYIRWLGDRKIITKDFNQISIDRSQDMLIWKEILNSISSDGLISYGFFNNHYAGNSPSSINLFQEMFYGEK